MRLLISAFEPFGGERLNPSQRVLEALCAESPGDPAGVSTTALLLPVARGPALARLETSWSAAPFDVWLGLGQAGGRDRISIERIALNLYQGPGAGRPGEAEPDAGEERLLADAPDAYVCRWPARELVGALLAAELPVALSYSAGLYVCNAVLFGMEHRLRARCGAPPAWAGFVHLPYMPEQLPGKAPGTPALALDLQVRTVLRAIEWLRHARATAAQQCDEARADHDAAAHRH